MGKSQTKEIVEYLREHKSITTFEAYEMFGATRLSSIIFALRERGFVIDTEMVNSKNRYGTPTSYAVYHLIKDIEDKEESKCSC